MALQRAVLQSAMTAAVEDRLLQVSPMPRKKRGRRAKDYTAAPARIQCWSALEARRFLEATKGEAAQTAAFFFLALDSGARKSELIGLGWEHVDLDAGTVTISRQLDRAEAGAAAPTFGPPKSGRPRTITIGAETVTALRAHRSSQAELRMKNRTSYRDHGLVFAKEPADLQTPDAQLGDPIRSLGHARFKRITKAAGLRRITFHGLRHTCATLSLAAGTPVHVVAARLGHSSPVITLNTYAHALQDMQQDAAARLRSLLHG